jgi:hypothetical protein
MSLPDGVTQAAACTDADLKLKFAHETDYTHALRQLQLLVNDDLVIYRFVGKWRNLKETELNLLK